LDCRHHIALLITHVRYRGFASFFVMVLVMISLTEPSILVFAYGDKKMGVCGGHLHYADDINLYSYFLDVS
jgi:hypothetical protein